MSAGAVEQGGIKFDAVAAQAGASARCNVTGAGGNFEERKGVGSGLTGNLLDQARCTAYAAKARMTTRRMG
jgi:hypothetical protein